MVVQRRRVADDEAGRRGGIAFGTAGAALVVLGIVSAVTGVPSAAHGLAPLGGLGELGTRLGEFSLPFSAAIAALVAGTIVALLDARRLKLGQAGIELLVLGVAVEACLLAAASRVGYAADGSVLPAAVACLTGGASIIAAGIVSIAASIVVPPAGEQ